MKKINQRALVRGEVKTQSQSTFDFFKRPGESKI